MTLSRALSLITLVLVLVTGSIGMASARHQARAVGEVVICTGYGIASVSVDADGKPTGPLVLCPDCVSALAALTDNAQPIIAAPTRLVPVLHTRRQVAPHIPDAPVHRQSRAPPVTV